MSIDRLLFQGEVFQIGAFRCPAEHPSFRDSGPTKCHDFVFPRTTVWIQHQGKRPFVADPNVVTFYNRGQAYVRFPLSPEGDRSDYFSVEPTTLCEVVRVHDAEAASSPDGPFRFDHGWSDPETYVVQRRLVRYLLETPRPDPLLVEEEALRILERVVANAYGSRPGMPPVARPGARDELVERTKAVIATRALEPLSLQTIASEAGSSVFHLCRAFRRGTGSTLHGYLTQVRLRLAIERLLEERVSLTELALDLGFSSHSHFTAAFRRSFGEPPSRLRRRRGRLMPARP
jgi:AraC-like DNA-binding protein